MSVETQLRALAQQVRHLLDCPFVILFLGCADSCLRHPLLDRLYCVHSHAFFATNGTLEYSLSCDSTMATLCDITIQTGLFWNIDRCVLQHGTCCALAVPLESARGTLGALVCLDTQREAFSDGEYALLGQYLPTLVQCVERVLREDACTLGGDISACMREQNDFISMVSHELRAPLTAIKGYAGLLHAYGIAEAQDDYAAHEMTVARQRQYLSAIIEQVDHLTIVISDLLDVSRIQAGRLALRCRKIDVSQLCQRVLQVMQDRAERQSPGQYRFRCIIEPKLPLVWADPDRVQQVLVNLLENAMKYSPDGGVIEMFVYTLQQRSKQLSLRPLSYSAGKETDEHGAQEVQTAYCRAASGIIGISIRDHGIGIPPLQQRALFQPFNRLKHPAAGQVAGSGLGLYISRRLVETMDGRIFLHSEEGQGTSVTFTLPAISLE